MRLVALTISYLLGSIPTAFLMVKWLKRIDVRTVGSGNVGATNVTRAAGVGAGCVVFLLDAAKGWIAACLVAPRLWHPLSPIAPLSCGLMAVIGHNFPVFLKFRGGKGVATTIGVLLGTMPVVGAIFLAVLAGCLIIWRYVSLGALIAAVTLPCIQWAMHQTFGELLLGLALSLLIIVRHRANIERLRQGKEHRLGSL